MILKAIHLYTAAGLLLQAASAPGVLAEGGITSETDPAGSSSGVGSVVFKKKSDSQVGSPNAWETDDKDFFKRFLKTPAAERKTATRRAKGAGGGGGGGKKPTTPKPHTPPTPKPKPRPTPKPYTPPTPKPYTPPTPKPNPRPTPKPHTAATPKPNGGVAPPPKAQKAGKGGNGNPGSTGGRNPKAGKGTSPKPGGPPVHPPPTPPVEPHPTPAPYKPSNGGTDGPRPTPHPVRPTPTHIEDGEDDEDCDEFECEPEGFCTNCDYTVEYWSAELGATYCKAEPPSHPVDDSGCWTSNDDVSLTDHGYCFKDWPDDACTACANDECPKCDDSTCIEKYNSKHNSDSGIVRYCQQTLKSTKNPQACHDKGLNFKSDLSGNAVCYDTLACDGDSSRGRKLIEQPDDEITLSTPMKNDLSVTGFVRVPKTGSTTMLKFVQQARRMYAWPRHLSEFPKDADGESKPAALRSTSCVFGHAPTTAHLGENYKPNSGSWWNSCPHIPYPRMVKTWSKSLDLWAPPKDAVYAEGTDMDSFSFSFEAFSIVRDPFDRLVSYFYYLTKFANKPFTDEKGFLSHTATKAQYDRVEAHDLVGWMELLHTEGGGRGLELPYQFKYFHSNVDEAIALIKGEDGNAPKIFTVINECFDVSLRLLTENFSGFESDAVDTFEKSDDFKSNANKKAYEKVSKESLKSLREKAEVWFADDYKFYDAAVEQYKLYLSATNMDKSHLEKCTYWAGDGVVGA